MLVELGRVKLTLSIRIVDTKYFVEASGSTLLNFGPSGP